MWYIPRSQYSRKVSVVSVINIFNLICNCPTSGRVVTLKTERREVPGSNPGRYCRPSRSEFTMVCFWNSRKYELGSLRKTPAEGIPPKIPGLTNGQLDSNQQPTDLKWRTIYLWIQNFSEMKINENFKWLKSLTFIYFYFHIV